QLLREGLDRLRAGLARRGVLDSFEPALADAVALDRERRSLIQQVEERKAERNANSQEVGRRKRDGEEVDELVARGRVLGDEISGFEQRLREVESAIDSILLNIPNITAEDV